MAGAMAVMFCMRAPVRPSACTWSWVVASTSPGSSTGATFSRGGLVAIPAAPCDRELRAFAQITVICSVWSIEHRVARGCRGFLGGLGRGCPKRWLGQPGGWPLAPHLHLHSLRISPLGRTEPCGWHSLPDRCVRECQPLVG